MSIETELKTFNEHFGRFIKTEEEKTAAISKLADAISQAVISPAEMRMQPSPAPVLNEAKSAKVQHSIVTPAQPAPAPIEQKATPSEKAEPVAEPQVEKEPAEEEKTLTSEIKRLCNHYARIKGISATKKIILAFGGVADARKFSFVQKKAFVPFMEDLLKSVSQEFSHA